MQRGAAGGDSQHRHPRRPIPGTKLVREWEGEEQVVTVLTDGFEGQGRLMPAAETLRVHIPLELRRRGGRPRILPPKHIEAAMGRGQDPHLLGAIGRLWGWRQRLVRGDVATLADLAADEGLSDGSVAQIR